MNKRIEPVDGLRTFAVLGVMWAHVWMFFGNPAWKFGPVDANRLISVIGNGVDLFFVISGFCMFVMYQKKSKQFNGPIYKDFIARRFKRIAPAFYLLIVVECLVYFFRVGIFPFKTAAFHVLFINIFLPGNNFSPHYWSLSTEWQFYIILPFLFYTVGGQKNISFRVFLLVLVTMSFRLFLFHQHQQDLLTGITVESPAIWYRFIEFGTGIVAGKLYLENYKLPTFLRGWQGFLLSFAIAYLGRIFIVTEFVARFKQYAFIVRAFGEPLMTFGFGLMLYGLITSDSIFRKLICARPILFIGKISYSMYLWHWLISVAISNGVLVHIGAGIPAFYLAFALSVLILIPVSWLSYRLFEAPYFKKGQHVPLRVSALAVTTEESI